MSASEERRDHSRQTLCLECSWTREARVTDVAAGGCYVDTQRVPKFSEPVEFSVLIDGRSITLRGAVVHGKPAIGFAIAFTSLDDDAAAAVQACVSRSPASGGGWFA